MKITVTNLDYTTILNEDNEFRCPHENVEVESPCCSGYDCGCEGKYNVYCEDCRNEDLRDNEAELITESEVCYE